MSNDNKSKVGILAVLVLLTLFLAPIFLSEGRNVEGESGGDPWRNTIYDFQTLFTGILAVGAATITIMQSRKIDERQQKRHDDMFDLQLRADKLRLARAYAFFDLLRMHRKVFDNWASIELPENEGDFTRRDQGLLKALEVYSGFVMAELSRPEMQDVKNLFDGKLHTNFNFLHTSLKSVNTAVKTMLVPIGEPAEIEAAPNVKVTTAMTLQRRQQLYFTVEFFYETMLENFDQFLGGFESLAREYKVVRTAQD